MIRARDFSAATDLRVMQEVVARSWQSEKPLVRFHIGDLAWEHHHQGREGEWRIRIWEDSGSGPLGWARLQPPDRAEVFALPRQRGRLMPEMVRWLAGEAAAAGGRRLLVGALDCDALTVGALEREGFQPAPEPELQSMVLDLRGRLPEPQLERGFRIRPVEGPDDAPRLVAVHRASFSVFAPSRVTEASYRKVMAAWPYREDLDWVVEAPDGRFASSCLAWLDEQNAVGELEPVGTDPAFWRRGFARAACAAALRALRDRGADTAVVYAAEIPGKPPARALYRSLGFRARARHITLAGPLSVA